MSFLLRKEPERSWWPCCLFVDKKLDSPRIHRYASTPKITPHLEPHFFFIFNWATLVVFLLRWSSHHVVTWTWWRCVKAGCLLRRGAPERTLLMTPRASSSFGFSETSTFWMWSWKTERWGSRCFVFSLQFAAVLPLLLIDSVLH